MTDLFPEKKADFHLPDTLDKFMEMKIIPQKLYR